MEWIKCKTNWFGGSPGSSYLSYDGDYFTADDYNRITGNIKFLNQEIVKSGYPGVDLLDMYDPKTYTDSPSYQGFTNLEENLARLSRILKSSNIFSPVTYTDNPYAGPSTKGIPDANRINQIEIELENLYSLVSPTE